ncbi:MAG: flagellar motor protein MotB [Deltaproteobacteria bacterium]|nr:flagellar motor protein MotB [Deltaproteobacteria bacterium]MBW2123195.1 flagellar motor protein MotB [Deltaproteobacteria bacterium]
MKGNFVVLMTSLSVLLLAFFILLNSMAVIDNHKIRMALGSLRGTFGVTKGGMGGMLGGGGPAGAGGVEAWNYLNRMNLSLGKKGEKLAALDEVIKEAGLGEKMDISVTREGTRISLAGEVLFPSGSSELTPEGRLILDRVAEVIRSAGVPARIEGHTDNIPIHTEAYSSNWELSTARAVNVLRYFIEEKGIAPARLSAEGFADTRPRAPNDTPEHRARNRRVSFVLLGTFL